MASFAGDLSILEIDLRETAVGSRVLQWGRVETKGIEAAYEPMSLKIDTIDIHGAGIEVVVSKEGKVNLIELLASMAERSEDNQETEMPPIEVAALTLHACSSAYTDRTLTPPFTLALDQVDGTVKGVSSSTTAGAAIEIEGPIHPIEEGKVDITLRYEITSSDLVGSNKFVTDGLALGDKVDGEGMVNLPIKLGVSLLTDKNGLITLEFPIEGNLDDPAFGIGNAIGSAAKEIAGELIKSPFRLLGKLGGGSGDEDLGFVGFDAGSEVLGNNANAKLQTLAAGADQRPELVLLVQGAWDPVADAIGLKKAAFEALTAEEEITRELYESMYLETASRESLDALRAQYTATDEDSGEEVLDETAYFRDLRAALIEAQPLDPSEIQALAGARAEAVRAFLVDTQAIDPARVRVIDSIPVEEPSGDEWVRCRLDVETGG
jgi:hypothetical protein